MIPATPDNNFAGVISQVIDKEKGSSKLFESGLLIIMDKGGRARPRPSGSFLESVPGLLLSFAYPTDYKAGNKHERQKEEDGDEEHISFPEV
jgi:hypothetical protein